MFEKIDLSKKVDRKTCCRVMDEAEKRLGLLQRECKDAGIPVVLVFEGVGVAGKGVQTNRFIQALDPRSSDVYACDRPTEDEQMRPFLWRYWTKTPAKGRIAVFDRSQYRSIQVDRFDGLTPEDELEDTHQDILSFKKQLCDDGIVIMKFFLYIDKDEQKRRSKKLEGPKETSWRMTDEDWNRNKYFGRYLKMSEETPEKIGTGYAPWVIIEAVDKGYAALKIASTVMDRLEYELKHSMLEEEKMAQGQETKIRERLKNGVFSGIDLSKSLTEEECKTRPKELQKHLAELHSELYRLRTPVAIGFEGWDAGDKDGAIKRLTNNLDPKGYRVDPTAAPNNIGKVHHYLWRFWSNVPKAGHIAVFDRTWYGRVMVERTEGFCSEAQWRRAYQKINGMESHMVNAETMALKFWLHIDKDEQERKFRERQVNPTKQWEVTDEDWRNREKWDQREEAVNEMLIRTSTTYAPWIVVERNDKRYARVKVLQTAVDVLEKKIKEVKTDK